MAERGKPIPFSTRMEIKQRRQELSVRQVAAELKVSPTTVQKYKSKFGTDSTSNASR